MVTLQNMVTWNLGLLRNDLPNIGFYSPWSALQIAYKLSLKFFRQVYILIVNFQWENRKINWKNQFLKYPTTQLTNVQKFPFLGESTIIIFFRIWKVPESSFQYIFMRNLQNFPGFHHYSNFRQFLYPLIFPATSTQSKKIQSFWFSKPII